MVTEVDRQRVRVGVIGGGKIAETVHIPGLIAGGAEVVALAHPGEERRDAVARRFGIPMRFADHSGLLSLAELDAVVVCSPNVTHYRIVEAALRAGKHVLCEKPLTLHAEESLALARLADEFGLAHMTAFTFRFVPAARYLRHLVAQGAIGRPLHWRAVYFTDAYADPAVPLTWRATRAESGGGALMDLGPHLADFALWTVGKITGVAAAMATFIPARAARGGGVDRVEVDDSCVFVASFDEGALGTFEMSRVIPGRGGTGRASHQVIEVAGTEGALEYRLERPYHLRVCSGSVLTSAHGWAEVEVPDEFKRVPGSPRNPWLPGDPMEFRLDQDVAFVQAVGRRERPSPDFFDGWRAQLVLDSVSRSAESRTWEPVSGLSVPRS